MAAVTLGGCITQEDASFMLSRDARYAPQIWNDAYYVELGKQLDQQEYVLASNNLLDCSTLFPDPKKPPGRSGGCTVIKHLTGTNLTDRQATNYYLEGRTQQVDKLCDAYLNTLAQMGDTSRWSRSQFNAIADVGSMVLGLAETPAQQLAYLSAGKSLYNQSTDNLENYLLLAPSADKIQRLVYTAQSTMRERKPVLRQTEDSEYWGATSRWVQEYAALCTPRGIRGLLNDAIDSQTAPISPSSVSDAASSLGQGMTTTLKIFATELKVDTSEWPVLSDPVTLGALAWRVRETPNPDERKFINQRLDVNLTVLLDTLEKDAGRFAKIRGNIDDSKGRYDELTRAAKATFMAGSAADRATSAEAQVAKLKDDVLQFQVARDDAQSKIEALGKEKAALDKEKEALKQALEVALAAARAKPADPVVVTTGTLDQ
ncbi:hypothetical protein [Caulobacter sp. Root655]|uniref:hypothetical protein n=1 Tax=Caulobacter sp. Root655 TaxID=1736578 RepID=UPI0012E331CD|nr:hypothetical protein [Caulobacter sp. Root655]